MKERERTVLKQTGDLSLARTSGLLCQMVIEKLTAMAMKDVVAMTAIIALSMNVSGIALVAWGDSFRTQPGDQYVRPFSILIPCRTALGQAYSISHSRCRKVLAFKN